MSNDVFLKPVGLFLLVCFYWTACQPKGSNKETDKMIFELQQASGISFRNDITNNKDFNILVYRNFYNGGGVATGDLNNDGLPEVFFTSNMGDNKLFLNKGDMKFEDVTKKSGFLQQKKWATGVTFVDINGDGWLDVYVCYAGYQKGVNNKNELYVNNHDMTFTEQAKSYLLDEEGFGTHAAFFDYDRDGDLDVYLLNNSFIPVNTLNYSNQRNLRAKDWLVKDFLKGGGDKLLKNEGGKFVDVSQKANIYGSLIGFGLGVTVGDVNDDGWLDLYISNDFFERDYLYINQKNGTFKEVLEDRMQHISHSSMGADIGDINNDGYPDIFTTDMLPDDDERLKTTTIFDNFDLNRFKQQQGFYNQYMQNTLQLNNGKGRFNEIAFFSGVAASDWSWGGLIFDADNDGRNDLFVCNGIAQDVTNLDFMEFFANKIIGDMVLNGNKASVDEVIKKMPSVPLTNKLYMNQGGLKFFEEGELRGLKEKTYSNGASYADLDNDGDLDLVVSNVNQMANVYKNITRERNTNHFVKIVLKDTVKGSANGFCIGAKVKIFCEKEVLMRELIPSRGFQSSVDYTLHFGLGKKSIDSVKIAWQDGLQTITKNVRIDGETIFYKPQKKDIQNSNKYEIESHEKVFFEEIKEAVFDKHVENEYVDFYKERGVPMMLSKQGPVAAVADVNGDGLDDVYIGGGMGQESNLYIQSKKGFEKKSMNGANILMERDVTGAIFFDANGDKYKDLWVGLGGNQKVFGESNVIFFNDGHGNFVLGKEKLPQMEMNVSVLQAMDFDADGDDDVFVGGRNVVQEYGLDANSYLFENDGKGNFKLFKDHGKNPFESLGMVTGAFWDKILEGQHKQLVIVGEWMAPKVFEFDGRAWGLKRLKELESLKGWWQCVVAEDVNGDGLKDMVLGNLGENFYLQATEDKPIKLWINDYDNNGVKDKIITRVYKGKDVTVFSKRELNEQLPFLKKENLNYFQFAQKGISELFLSPVLEKSLVKEVTIGSTIILQNKGAGKFDIKYFSPEANFSSTNKILAIDVNGDGLRDLMLGGNNFDLLPQFSRLDGSYGEVMLRERGNNFTAVGNGRAGWFERGVVRDIKQLVYKNKEAVLVLVNNGNPKLYALKKEIKK